MHNQSVYCTRCVVECAEASEDGSVAICPDGERHKSLLQKASIAICTAEVLAIKAGLGYSE